MRKLIIAAVFFFAIALVIISFSELQEIAETLQRSMLRFLMLALVVQLVWHVNMAAAYRAIYRLMGLEESLWRLLLVASAANFVNVVAPSAGVGGMAVFLDDAGRRGHSRGHVAAASALFTFLDYVAFLCVLGLGLIVLVRRNNLDTGEISASVVMVVLVLAMGYLIYVGSRSASALGSILARLGRLVNRIMRPFIHRDYLDEARAHSFALEISDGLSVLHGNPRGLALPMLYILNGKALQIVVLMLIFLNFSVAFSAGTLIAGFAIGYLFLVVSPTPSGLGIVEGVLPLALASLRVPWGAAVVVTLVYRAVTFWFALGVGALAFRLLHRPGNALTAE